MNLIVLTPVRLLGDGLVACLSGRAEIDVVAVIDELQSLRETLSSYVHVDLILIDITHGVNLVDIRNLAAEIPSVALVALGLSEQAEELIQCGRAGFSGYVARSATVDVLVAALSDAVNGRLGCSPEISAELLRALSAREASAHDEQHLLNVLTRRERDVLQLIGEGLSNKEIARSLCLSVATVKHHVHHVLEKLKLARRAEAMHRIRSLRWSTMQPIKPDRILTNSKQVREI